jgi:hypothetical protein
VIVDTHTITSDSLLYSGESVPRPLAVIQVRATTPAPPSGSGYTAPTLRQPPTSIVAPTHPRTLPYPAFPVFTTSRLTSIHDPDIQLLSIHIITDYRLLPRISKVAVGTPPSAVRTCEPPALNTPSDNTTQQLQLCPCPPLAAKRKTRTKSRAAPLCSDPARKTRAPHLQQTRTQRLRLEKTPMALLLLIRAGEHRIGSAARRALR